MSPLVSIIIVGFNHKFCLSSCLNSIRNYNFNDIEIIYIDNNSIDESLEFVHNNFQNVKVISNKSNLGFSKANNQGIQIAKGKYIFILNPDVILKEKTLDLLIEFMLDNPQAGMCMPKILLADKPKIINSLGMTFLKNGRIIHINDGKTNDNNYPIQEIPCLPGAAIFTTKKILDEIGGFDEDFFAYGEDVELSLRCWSKGYKCYVVPEAEIYHTRNSAAKKSREYYELAKYFDVRNRYWNHIIYFRARVLTAIFIRRLFPEIYFSIKYFAKSIINRNYEIDLKARIDFFKNFPKLIHKRRKLKFGSNNNLIDKVLKNFSNLQV